MMNAVHRNLSANNFQSLFARTGFFDIIMLSANLPLFKLPFQLPFSLSTHPSFHKSSTILVERKAILPTIKRKKEEQTGVCSSWL